MRRPSNRRATFGTTLSQSLRFCWGTSYEPRLSGGQLRLFLAPRFLPILRCRAPTIPVRWAHAEGRSSSSGGRPKKEMLRPPLLRRLSGACTSTQTGFSFRSKRPSKSRDIFLSHSTSKRIAPALKSIVFHIANKHGPTEFTMWDPPTFINHQHVVCCRHVWVWRSRSWPFAARDSAISCALPPKPGTCLAGVGCSK